MADPKGFLKYGRKDNPMRPIMQRIKDFDAMELDLDDGDRRQQAARCMNCGIPFCHHGVFYGGGRAVAGCPNDNLIPEWNDLVYQSRDQQAFERLTKTNYLPDMTGRVCPAPCEAACVQALNGPGITIRNNEKFIIEQGFKYGWVVDSGKPLHRTGKKIAVIGSGPAGISVAWRLNQLGHSVTIFERDDRFGGLLMYGIPNMKLPKNIVERRIETLRQVGIELVANTEVGKDISADELRNRFDRIVICTGAREARNLDVEGRDLKGIYQAVDYLRLSTQAIMNDGVAATTSLKGKHVLVLGGGDTGNDCIGTVIRQGWPELPSWKLIRLFQRNEPKPISGQSGQWFKKMVTAKKKPERCLVTLPVTQKQQRPFTARMALSPRHELVTSKITNRFQVMKPPSKPTSSYWPWGSRVQNSGYLISSMSPSVIRIIRPMTVRSLSQAIAVAAPA